MSEVGTLDSIDAVMESIQQENNADINQGHSEVAEEEHNWIKKDAELVEDEAEAEEVDGEEEEEVDHNVREEIKAALMAGQKTITLSADDSSLEAKILEIVRQSRHLDQGDGSQQQYIEIVNDEEGQVASRLLGGEAVEGQSNGQRVVEIDLMNFKLVRYQDEGAEDDGSGHGIGSLVMAEHDDSDGQQYILANGNVHGTDSDAVHYIHNTQNSKGGVQYVQVIEKDKVPLVYFTTEQPKLQKHVMPSPTVSTGKRKRGEFILSADTMNSPNFKLFLYNCKLCDFKCNAIKELTAHKAMHPGIGPGRYRSIAKPPSDKPNPLNDFSPITVSSNLRQYDLEYCNQCMYKTVSKTHLNRHIAKCHSNQKGKVSSDTSNSKSFTSFEDSSQSSKDTISLYVCKLCNFKSENKNDFRRHKCQQC